jgi:hypothetical protein
MTGPDAERERCRLHARAQAYAEAAALAINHHAAGSTLKTLGHALLQRAGEAYADIDALDNTPADGEHSVHARHLRSV